MSSSSSFSLPAASGFVSLLNDTEQPAASGGPKANRSLSRTSAIQKLPSPNDFGSSSSSDVASCRTSANESSAYTSPPSSINAVSNDSSRDSSAESLKNGDKFADLKQRQANGSDRSGADSPRKSHANNGDGTSRVRASARSPRQQHLTVPNKLDRSSVLGNRIATSPKPMGLDNGSKMSTNNDVPSKMLWATESTGKSSSTDGMDIDLKETSEHSANGHETPVGQQRHASFGSFNGISVNGATSPSSSSSSAAGNSTNGAKSTRAKKRYPCAYDGCEKTFSTSGHAARHHRIHTGQKPFHCTFPGCKAVFSRQDNSLQHYRTHVCLPKNRAVGETLSDSLPRISSERVPQHQPHSILQSHTNGGGESAATIGLQNGATAPERFEDKSVSIGREALENGTAIAVVQEIIDEDGRPREVVQRTVGVPKANRQGPTVSSQRPPHQMLQQQKQEHTSSRKDPMAYEARSQILREDDMGSESQPAPSSFRQENGYSRQMGPGQNQLHGEHERSYSSSAPRHLPTSSTPAVQSTGPMPSPTYPAPVYVGHDGGSGHGGSVVGSGSGSSSGIYRHHPYAQMQPSAPPSMASSSSSSLSSSFSSSRSAWDDSKSTLERHGAKPSSAYTVPKQWSDYSRNAVRDGLSPSPSLSASSYNPSVSSYAPPGRGVFAGRRLSDTYERKRYMSSHGSPDGDHFLSRPSLARFANQASGSTWPPLSPAPSLHQQRNGEATRNFPEDPMCGPSLARTPFSVRQYPPTSYPSPTQVKSAAIPVANAGLRSNRGSGPNLRLDGPLPSISQLPCSSDRSTSLMTPTTPLEGMNLHSSSSQIYTSEPDQAPESQHRPVVKLPPLRNA